MPKDTVEEGQTYDRLETLYKLTGGKWQCVCSCGNVVVVSEKKLLSGKIRSCGCLLKEDSAVLRQKAAATTHPLYVVWRNMWTRCTDKNFIGYQYYGGKGIRICKDWEKYEGFYAWGIVGWKEGLTIEREDCAKGYSPDNCTWVPKYQQAWNKTDSIRLQVGKEEVTLGRICQGDVKLLCKLRERVKNGWSVRRTLETP